MSSHIRVMLASLVILLSSLTSQAQNFNIDVGSLHGTPSDAYGAASGQTGPWNTVGTAINPFLTDTSNSPTSVMIGVTADTDEGSGPSCATADGIASLSDNIYTQHGTWAVNLWGLANDTYVVFLYAPSNEYVATGDMLVNGTPVASVAGTTDCDVTEGVGMARVTVDVLDGTLAMTGDSTGTGFDYAGIAAIQIMVDPTVFIDGFETSDTSMWSSTVL
jgi:hypothetical protein